MKSSVKRTLLVLVMLPVLAGLAWAATGRERSVAVYPAQSIPLIFDHAQHIDDGAECTTCHDKARISVKASDLNLPGHPECETCHEIADAKAGKNTDPPSDCEVCHKGYDPDEPDDVAKAHWPTANILFDHRLHQEKNVECKVCHSEMLDVGLATRQQLPKMETCFQCHDGKKASQDCASCHPALPSGRIQTQFATALLRPIQGNPLGLDHGPRYEFTHGTRAALDSETCLTCHQHNECQQCHDSLQKPLAVHPNDYMTLHPVQARMDSTRCESCHRFQSFCVACHERAGVSTAADTSLRARNVKIHPNYTQWVEILGPQHHAIVASRDIKQCMACHREDSCMACHATQQRVPNSRGTNPHPNGFSSTCKSMASMNDRACLKCHTNEDLISRGCK